MSSDKPRIFRRLSVCVLAATLGQIPSSAAAQPTQPAPLPANPGGVEKLPVTITAVVGTVQYRTPPGPWKPCTVGLVLDEGVEFRTLLKSSVQFTIPPDQTITLDRLGVVKVIQAIRDRGKVTTDVGMPHGGRVRLDIQAGDIEHQGTIRSPNSTLAVTGTDVALFDQGPFPAQAVSFTGRAKFTSAKGQTSFGGKGAGKTQVAAGQTAAAHQLADAVVDPSILYARTPQEQALVANLLSEGSVFTIANKGAIPVVHGGTPPMTDAQLLPLLPGKLDFVLRWTGNANLDLIVVTESSRSDFMLPATGVNTSRSGGRIPFDHQGGRNGGIEIGYWLNKFPLGFDSALIYHTSGATAAFTLDVFIDKKRTTILDPLGNQVTTFAGTVGPGQNAQATVPIGLAPPVNPGPPPNGTRIKLTNTIPVAATAATGQGKR